MTIWQTYNKNSSVSNIFTNRQIEDRKISQSSLEIKLVSSQDGVSFPEALCEEYAHSYGVLSFVSSHPINTDLTISFNWFNQEDSLVISSLGNFAPTLKWGESGLTVSSTSLFVIAKTITDNSTHLGVGTSANIYFLPLQQNWIKWSDIGNLDFTIGLSNVAGERPMDWPGQVYKIKKLGTNVVVYGANGISLLTPHDVSYGLTNISKIGLKGRNAIIGDSLSHFFISSLGDLYKFDTQLQKLGYQEYLAPMNSPVLSYDERTKIIYICDGNLGYVYATENGSFGIGPPNITGIGYQDDQSYVATPSTVSIPIFEIWTDIIDFGTRGAKTLYSIEFGVDATEPLQAAFEFRVDKSQSFSRTHWAPVSPAGISHIFCHGIEFRVGVRANSYTYLELDSLSIEGRIT